MRLWTLHPKYLDPPGLTAVWREALLARAILLHRTRGYRFHPQLQRFRAHARPVAAINSYLAGILEEARARSYRFDAGKVGRVRLDEPLTESRAQLLYEWRHLQAKLSARNPAWSLRFPRTVLPEPHPLFRIVPGPVQSWERVSARDARQRSSVDQ